MIVYYSKKTKEVFGTSNGFKDDGTRIRPEGVPDKDIGLIILDRKFMRNNPELIADITHKRVVDAEGLKFEDDPSKKEYKTPAQPVNSDWPIISFFNKKMKKLQADMDKKIEEEVAKKIAELEKR